MTLSDASILKWHAFQTAEFHEIVDRHHTTSWATMTSTPSNPDHYMGNCIYVDASVAPPASAELDALEAIQRQHDSRVVYQFIRSEHVPSTHAMTWQALLAARGLEIEVTPAWLLSVDLATLPVHTPTRHVTRVLNTIDDIMTADGDASPHTTEAWYRHLRQRQLGQGPTYGCFVGSMDAATDHAVGLVSLHAASGTTAIVNWCGVHAGFRRQGHGESALVRALEYARDVCGCRHVLLTAVEEGPIRLYKHVGFQVVDQGDEIQALAPLKP
ncbi:Aste57867_95 [Aphanomyces stellatus]|uniref:Aste57867_95 protein n=1 Tax=Aphanomyces stellatus TaxID=120398 RepID=A0A485K6W0_9STRA|nr:hypothetical protein As57867_000095 [Aphanomyces stellatus]VFT77321.1 Aste57867_95 [Aphanomyces stellatus]